MRRPALKRCNICGATKNLIKQGCICKPCKAARDKKYNEKRLIQQANARKNAKLAGLPFHVPPEKGPCGLDYDPEVCPKRRKLAIQRAKTSKRIEVLACLQCEINQEAQQ